MIRTDCARRGWPVLVGILVACTDAGAPPARPVPAALVATTALDQVGPSGTDPNELPAVRVLDAAGTPLRGIEVRWVAANGAPPPATTLTDAAGASRTPAWPLPSGPGEMRAEVEGLAPVVFRAVGHPRRFDLAVRWTSPPTPEARTAVEAAEALLEQLIWDDLADESLNGVAVCPIGGQPVATLTETIDDVLILAQIGPMDGPGGGSAQGFPCLIRDPGTQTIVGFIRFDEADWPSVPPELRREIALHELVHALGMVPGVLNISTPTGFARACVQQPSTGGATPVVRDTHFACPNAVAMFDRVGGTRYGGPKVPLENGATRPLGANTLNHHWRKTTLTNELMTGWFVAGQPAPLSLVTAGALADLGYAVSYPAAESYTLATVIAGLAAPSRGIAVHEPNEVPAPVRTLTHAGRRKAR